MKKRVKSAGMNCYLLPQRFFSLARCDTNITKVRKSGLIYPTQVKKKENDIIANPENDRI